LSVSKTTVLPPPVGPTIMVVCLRGAVVRWSTRVVSGFFSDFEGIRTRFSLDAVRMASKTRLMDTSHINKVKAPQHAGTHLTIIVSYIWITLSHCSLWTASSLHL
jgi:hypothetical protein